MPQGIVDFLEMIEVQAEHSKLVVAAGTMQRLLELLAKQRAVRQIGQRVMARHVENLFLYALPVGDVLEGCDPAAAFHRLCDDADLAVKLVDDPFHALAGSHFAEQSGKELVRISLPAPGRLQFPKDVEQQSSRELHTGS